MTTPGRWPRHSMDDTPTAPIYDFAAAAWWPALAAETPTVPLPRLPRRRPRAVFPPPDGRAPHVLDPDLLRRIRDGLRNLPTDPR